MLLISYFTFLTIYAKNTTTKTTKITTSRLNHDVYVYAQKYNNFSQLYNWSAIAIGFEGQCGIWGKGCGTQIVIPEGVTMWQGRLVPADTWFVRFAKIFATDMCPFEVVRNIIIEADVIVKPKVRAGRFFRVYTFLAIDFSCWGR